jgi:hypothetical protein
MKYIITWMSILRKMPLITILGVGLCIGTAPLFSQNNDSYMSPVLNTTLTNIYVHDGENNTRGVDFEPTDFGDEF